MRPTLFKKITMSSLHNIIWQITLFVPCSWQEFARKWYKTILVPLLVAKLDGIMHNWANPHFEDFEILGVFESSHHKFYLPKEQNV